MALKLGRRLATKRCKWCRAWEIHECGNTHRSVFGTLHCSQCNSRSGTPNTICASRKHPSNKRRWDH